MFILCGADIQSFGAIKDVLQDFHHFSGLEPNLRKSAYFFAGVSLDCKQI